MRRKLITTIMLSVAMFFSACAGESNDVSKDNKQETELLTPAAMITPTAVPEDTEQIETPVPTATVVPEMTVTLTPAPTATLIPETTATLTPEPTVTAIPVATEAPEDTETLDDETLLRALEVLIPSTSSTKEGTINSVRIEVGEYQYEEYDGTIFDGHQCRIYWDVSDEGCSGEVYPEWMHMIDDSGKMTHMDLTLGKAKNMMYFTKKAGKYTYLFRLNTGVSLMGTFTVDESMVGKSETISTVTPTPFVDVTSPEYKRREYDEICAMPNSLPEEELFSAINFSLDGNGIYRLPSDDISDDMVLDMDSRMYKLDIISDKNYKYVMCATGEYKYRTPKFFDQGWNFTGTRHLTNCSIKEVLERFTVPVTQEYDLTITLNPLKATSVDELRSEAFFGQCYLLVFPEDADGIEDLLYKIPYSELGDWVAEEQ